MSFHSSKLRVASQHCSSEKMDKTKKDLMTSLNRSPSHPSTSSEASCQDHSPGTSSLLPENCKQGQRKDSTFRPQTSCSDIFTPGASNISEVSAKGNSFSITVLLPQKDLWYSWYEDIQLLTQVLALHFGERPLCNTFTLTK